jgi:hypothetical protein
MFRTDPLSIIRSFSLHTQQWYITYRFADSLRGGSGRNVLILLVSCLTYTIPVCTVTNSWWWIEELFETCRVLFQKEIYEINASIWFYHNNLPRFTVTWTSNVDSAWSSSNILCLYLHKNHKFTAHYRTPRFALHSGWVCNIPALHSGGPGFTSRAGDRLSWDSSWYS